MKISDLMSSNNTHNQLVESRKPDWFLYSSNKDSFYQVEIKILIPVIVFPNIRFFISNFLPKRWED